MAGIRGYRPSIQNAKLHKERTQAEFKTHYNASGEAEVVAGFQLAAVLKDFKERWEIEHDKDGMDWEVSKLFIGPLQYIELETERCAVKVGVRYLNSIITGEILTPSYSKAEAILMALGKEYMLKNGEIPVIPNPNWSPERWFEYMQERGCI